MGLKEHERIHEHDRPFSCSNGDKTLIPADVDKVDMVLLKQFKKQKNLCNNMIKKDIRKALGKNVSNKSSITEIWKAIVDILKPERMACNSWKIEVDGEYIEAPEELVEAEWPKFSRTIDMDNQHFNFKRSVS